MNIRTPNRGYDIFSIGSMGDFDDLQTFESQKVLENSPGGWGFEHNSMPRPVDYDVTMGAIEAEMMGDMSRREDISRMGGFFDDVTDLVAPVNPFSPDYIPYKAAAAAAPSYVDPILPTTAEIVRQQATKQPDGGYGDYDQQLNDVFKGDGMFGKDPSVSIPNYATGGSNTSPYNPPITPAMPLAAPPGPVGFLDGETFGLSNKLLLLGAGVLGAVLILKKKKRGKR